MSKLESIIWPECEIKIDEIMGGCDGGVVLLEAAVLDKAGWDRKYCDITVTLKSSEGLRVKRLIERNGMSENEAKMRVEGQRGKVKEGGVLVVNDGGREELEEEVERIWMGIMEEIN